MIDRLVDFHVPHGREDAQHGGFDTATLQRGLGCGGAALRPAAIGRTAIRSPCGGTAGAGGGVAAWNRLIGSAGFLEDSREQVLQNAHGAKAGLKKDRESVARDREVV